MEFGLKRLEISLCRTVWNVCRYLKPRRRGSRVWETDRQTTVRSSSVGRTRKT